jgi:predicted metal-binding protein
MIDLALLESQLAELPLYIYTHIDPKALEFSPRIRYICQAECPMYNKTWACPPAVGSVEECKAKCHTYEKCLLVGTITETDDISDLDASLATRQDHEKLTNIIRDLFREQGVHPYILSTEACAICQRCAWLDGLPCRLPGKMHPCLESHGINVIPTLEALGLEFQYGSNIITWYSLLFYND